MMSWKSCLSSRHPSTSSSIRIFSIRQIDGPLPYPGEDPAVPEWAAIEGRVLLTHDASTMSAFAYERVKLGLAMSGIFEVSQDMPIGQAIEEIILIAGVSFEGEYEGQVRYLPLK